MRKCKNFFSFSPSTPRVANFLVDTDCTRMPIICYGYKMCNLETLVKCTSLCQSLVPSVSLFTVMFSSFEEHEMKVFQLPPLTYVLWCEKREVSVFSNCQSRVNTVETGKQDPQFKPDVEQEWGARTW